MTKFENEPVIEVKVPLPKDQLGCLKEVSLIQLEQLIHKRVALLTQPHSAKSKALNLETVRNAGLRFADDALLVQLKIPVPPLLMQAAEKPGASSRNLDLFGRHDSEALVAVQENIEHLHQVGRGIQDLSSVLLTPNLSPNEALLALASTNNPEVRDFVVKGDSLDLNVDQRHIHLSVSPLDKAIELNEVTRLRVKLDHNVSQPGIKGKILAVLAGPLGVCRVGGTLPLGHVKKKPIEKALLQLAASLNIEVQVCVRVVVSKTTLKPLTAEVLAVENAKEIFAAALQYQTEKSAPSRGGASSVASEEADFDA